MRQPPGQFTLRSIMIAIAIIAVVIAVPLLSAVAIGLVYVVLCILISSLLAYGLIVAPGYVLLDRIDRWRDARRVASIRRTTGGAWRRSPISLLDPRSPGE